MLSEIRRCANSGDSVGLAGGERGRVVAVVVGDLGDWGRLAYGLLEGKENGRVGADVREVAVVIGSGLRVERVTGTGPG